MISVIKIAAFVMVLQILSFHANFCVAKSGKGRFEIFKGEKIKIKTVISKNTVFPARKKPYLYTQKEYGDNLKVAKGAVMKLNKGACITMGSRKEKYISTLDVNGTLIAEGTPQKPVDIDLKFILFKPGSVGVFRHCKVGVQGITISKDADVRFEYCKIYYIHWGNKITREHPTTEISLPAKVQFKGCNLLGGQVKVNGNPAPKQYVFQQSLFKLASVDAGDFPVYYRCNFLGKHVVRKNPVDMELKTPMVVKTLYIDDAETAKSAVQYLKSIKTKPFRFKSMGGPNKVPLLWGESGKPSEEDKSYKYY